MPDILSNSPKFFRSAGIRVVILRTGHPHGESFVIKVNENEFLSYRDDTIQVGDILRFDDASAFEVVKLERDQLGLLVCVKETRIDA